MMIITVLNQKGGVGKSTTVANLGAALAERGSAVLAVDLDPQGTLTIAMGADPSAHGTAEALGAGLPSDAQPPNIRNLVTRSERFGMDVLSSNVDRLTAREEGLRANSTLQLLLADQLVACDPAYDVVLIDSPPNLGALTVSGIYASDAVLVVIDAAGEAMHGLGLLKATLGRAKRIKPDLKILGAIVNRLNAQAQVDAQVLQVVQADQDFPFVSSIRSSTVFKQAFVAQSPVIRFAPRHPVAQELRDLAERVEASVRAEAA